MLRKISLTAILLAFVVLVGLSLFRLSNQASRGDGSKLSVAASYYPLYDFARNVGGDKVIVTNLTPAGAEPHDFEPSPKDLAGAYNSDVFMHNGVQMEPWVDSFLRDYSRITVTSSQGIELRATTDEENGDHTQEATGKDPHFWLDPVLAQKIVNNIRDGLIRADPSNSNYYQDMAREYNEDLAGLAKDFEKGLSNCKLNTVISSHQAFSYLADRYNFTVESIAGIEPEDEPSAAKMAEITELVRQKNIRYIFFESLVSPRLANTIAHETGADTLVFDPLEGLSQDDQDKGRDYISVQRDNLANLRTALQCS